MPTMGEFVRAPTMSSSVRFSSHLRAEEAASSLETLIHDYEARGRKLAQVESALRTASREVRHARPTLCARVPA